jgi:hypothetical protein
MGANRVVVMNWFKREWHRDSVALLTLCVTAVGAIFIPIMLLGIQITLANSQKQTKVSLTCTINSQTPSMFTGNILQIAGSCTLDNLSEGKATISRVEPLLFLNGEGNIAPDLQKVSNKSVDYPSQGSDFDIQTKLPHTLDKSEQARFRAILRVPFGFDEARADKLDACSESHANFYIKLGEMSNCIQGVIGKPLVDYIYEGVDYSLFSHFNGVGLRVVMTDGTVVDKEIPLYNSDLPQEVNGPATKLQQKDCWVFGQSDEERRTGNGDFSTVCGTWAKTVYVAIAPFVAALVFLFIFFGLKFVRHLKK